jgi:nanoRNase/pAp phosphatase (c-di-AMP/oligoRNAs hydrolase)
MLDINQQIISQIEKANQILVVFKQNWKNDTVASAIALYLWLKKNGKTVDIISDDFEVPQNLKFLNGIEEIKKSLNNIQKFIIKLNLKDNKIENFSYDIQDDNLKIFITPKEGEFSNDNLSSEKSAFLYDLIISINSPDTNSFGKIREKNIDFFFETPIINIDNSPENEYFGQINLVNNLSSSTSEIIYDFLKTNFKSDLDENIATCLMAGIMSATAGFKSGIISPSSLLAVSDLISLGADREKIAQNIFQNKPLSSLKLYGRILARLECDRKYKMAWSILSYEDFIKSGASEKDVDESAIDVMNSLPQTEIIAILYEYPSGEYGANALDVKCKIFTSENHSAMDISKNFNSKGDKRSANFIIKNEKLLPAEKIVIEEIKKTMALYQ